MADGASQVASSSLNIQHSKCPKCSKKVANGVKCLNCDQLCHFKCAGGNAKVYGEENSEIWICTECSITRDAMTDTPPNIIELLQQRVADLVYIVELQKKRINELEKRETTEKEERPRVNAKSYSETVSGNYQLISIKAKIVDQEKTKTRAEVTSRINPAKLPVGVQNIRQNNSGDILISCDSSKSASSLIKEANEVLGDNYVASITPKFNPRLKVTHVEFGDEDMDSIRKAIIMQNQLNSDRHNFACKIITTIKTKNGSSFAILEVDPQTRNTLLQEGKINIGWRRYSVFDHIHLSQCFNCGGFNHRSRDCTRKKVCLKCSGSHTEIECNAPELQCVNCSKSTTTLLHSHDCRSHDCPSRLKALKIMKQRIAYEDD